MSYMESLSHWGQFPMPDDYMTAEEFKECWDKLCRTNPFLRQQSTKALYQRLNFGPELT